MHPGFGAEQLLLLMLALLPTILTPRQCDIQCRPPNVQWLGGLTVGFSLASNEASGSFVRWTLL